MSAFGTASAPTTSFSGFGSSLSGGTAAPATSTFGGTGATATPAFGGTSTATGSFGAGAQAPTAQPGAFGAPTTPSTQGGAFGGGGFGSSLTPAASSTFGSIAAPASSTLGGAASGGFGTTSTPSMTSGLGGGSAAFGTTAGFPTMGVAGGGFQQQQRMQRSITLNTLFKELNEYQQREIVSVENSFKAPMRAALEEISEDTGKHHVDLHYSLNEVKVLAMKLTNSQNELLSKVGALKEQVRRTAHDCQRYGRDEIQKIASRQDSYSRHSNLPNSYFRNHLQHLAEQQKEVTSKIEQFDRLMYSVRKALSKRLEESRERGRGMNSSSTNELDNRTYVGSKQIHRLIKVQNSTFTAISTTVAELHRETEGLRRDYLRALAQQGHLDDPFKAADNRERAEADSRLRKVQEVLEDDYNAQGRGPPQLGTAQPQGQLMGAPAPQQSAPGVGFGAGNTTSAGATSSNPGSGFGGGFGSLGPPSAPAGGAFGSAFGAAGTTPGGALGGGAFGSTSALDLARPPKKNNSNRKR